MKKGQLTTEYWVSCGLCGQQRDVGESQHSRAVDAARMLGYKLKKALGWVCPECVPKIPEKD